MLITAAFAPSSPLLLESVNKHKRAEVQEAVTALEELADEWYARKIETIVVITESRFAYPDATCIDVADPYTVDLSSFGDLSSVARYHPDFSVIDALQRFARHRDVALTLSTESSLPFGVASALFFLSRRLTKIKIVPIIPAQQFDAKKHFDIGISLKHVLSESSKRIAILATGDVSVAHLETMRITLEEKSTASLLKLAPEMKENENDASYRSLSLLFGMLDGFATRAEIRSISSPFDAGYVVAEFLL